MVVVAVSDIVRVVTDHRIIEVQVCYMEVTAELMSDRQGELVQHTQVD